MHCGRVTGANGGLGVHRRATASHQVTCSSRGSPPEGFGVPLQLTDRESGITVCLVSTMRYNPTSILRVVGTVDMGELAPASPRQCTLCSACMYSQSNRRNRAQHRGQWAREKGES